MPDALAASGPGLYALIARAGDGTPGAPAAVQMILRTDFAPTIWRGTDGLTVQVRGYSDVLPRAGVTLRLLAENNEILGETTTDADGVGRFAAPLLHGEGPVAPRALEVMGGEDYTMLDLSSAAFDLSDRGVAGLPHPGPLDAYVWLDRGIYRPGETAQVMALLRDNAGRPADIPVHVIVKRPNGQVFLDATPARLAEASIHLPVALSTGAPAGTWTIEVKADPDLPPIGRAQFRVDAFVPDRMAVEFGAGNGPIVPGKPYTLPVTARFLYGAPAAGLTGQGQMRLLIDPAPFPALAGYRIGLVSETYAPDAQDLTLPDTDEQGHTTLAIAVPRAPDTTHALKASITVGVNDPSGHASLATTEIPVRPAGNLIGIKPAFAGDAVDAGTEAAFDIAAVNPDGTRTALKAKLRLVRERPDWRLVMHGSLARYETVWRDEPLETRAIDDPGRRAAPLRAARWISAATGSRCWRTAAWPPPRCGSAPAGCPPTIPTCPTRWTSRPTARPMRPATPRASTSPRRSPARRRCWCCRTACMWCATLSVPAGGTDVDVPVSADWGPGAYVTVHVFRTAADAKSRPGRAIGLAWVGIDPGVRKLPMAFEAADKYPPRARAAIRLRTAPGAWVSLAAVDEGILRLTRFVSPDPTDHFLGRRRLGLDIRDDWGRLIAPPDGEATVLRQGGDEGSFVLPDIPQKTVTLFVPPVQAGADGVVEFPLDLPDFNGQVRLMAVAWSGSRLGAAVDRRLCARSAGGRTAAAALPGARRPGAADAAAAQPRAAGRRAGGHVLGRRTAGDLRRDASGRHAGAGCAGAAVHHADRDRGRARHRPAGCRRAPAASTSSARPRSPCVRRAGRRRWSRRASLRRAPRCSSRRRSISSWPGTWKAAATFGGAGALRRGRTGAGARPLSAVVPRTGDQPRLPAGPAAGRPDWRGRTAPRGCNRRSASCSIASASTAASGCGRRRRRRNPGCRSTRPSSCCARAMPARRSPSRR